MKKGKNLRRNVTLAVVIVCLSAAVFLNIAYNKRCDAELNATSTAGAVANETDEDAVRQQVSDYFAQARLTRQQSRDEAIRLLESASSCETASKETIDSAISTINVMANYSMQESQIENLLLAKNFEDCVAFISDEGVTIAVPSPPEGLSGDEVAKITDAVIAETTFVATQIKVIEVKYDTPTEKENVEATEEPTTKTGAIIDEKLTIEAEAIIDEKPTIETGAIIDEKSTIETGAIIDEKPKGLMGE